MPRITGNLATSLVLNHQMNTRTSIVLRDFELLSRRFSLLCIVLSALGRRAVRCGGRGSAPGARGGVSKAFA
jgi:hypothetical protein